MGRLVMLYSSQYKCLKTDSLIIYFPVKRNMLYMHSSRESLLANSKIPNSLSPFVELEGGKIAFQQLGANACYPPIILGAFYKLYLLA